MNIVYLGSGEFGIDCLEAIIHSQHHIVQIFTQPPHQAGRGRKPKQTPVAIWAQQHNIPLEETQNINDPQEIEKIASLKPDLMVVIAFGQKISDPVIKCCPKGAINVHASVLPKFRGAAPINWAIINGETSTGISIITLAQKMDAGDILAQAATEINPDENAQLLHDRLAKLAAPLLLETIDKIKSGVAEYKKQDISKITHAPKLKKSDGFLDFNQPAEILRRKILGLWPWPGASAHYINKITGKCCRVIFASADVIETSNPKNLSPGLLDDSLNITCSQNTLKINLLKPADSSIMSFKDFANGRNTHPGDLFTPINL